LYNCTGKILTVALGQDVSFFQPVMGDLIGISLE